MRVRILAISGSLRTHSSNSAVLDAAARVAPAGVEVVIYGDLGALPHFNPDLDGDALPPLAESLRAEVGRADALLISSPEYAHGIPGSLKNLLDWLVGSLEFPGKPVMLINTSPRARHAQEQLLEVLTTMNADLILPAPLTLPLLGRTLSGAEIAMDSQLSAPLRAAMESLRQVKHHP